MPAVFLTERLLLNLLTEDDSSFMISLVNSKGWIEYIGDRNIHTIDDSVRYIDKLRNTPDLFYWVVKLRKDTIPIGIISFLKRSYLEHFDIGFAFLPEFCGYGYAYEAAAVILSTASKEVEHTTILATTVPHNKRSVRLLLKLGLHFERAMQTEDKVIHVYTNS